MGNSIKCANCNLVNVADAQVCKRCGNNLMAQMAQTMAQAVNQTTPQQPYPPQYPPPQPGQPYQQNYQPPFPPPPQYGYPPQQQQPMQGAPIKTTSPWMIAGISVVGFFVFVCMAGAFFGGHPTGTGNSSSSERSTPAEPPLKMTDMQFEATEYSTYITGTVQNNTDHQYRYVQIEFNLYDEGGAQVGSTFTNVTNLEAKGTWKFKALVIEKNVSRAKLKGINGY